MSASIDVYFFAGCEFLIFFRTNKWTRIVQQLLVKMALTYDGIPKTKKK